MTQQSTLKNQQALTLREAEPHDAENILAYIEQIAGESENITFGPGEFTMTLEQEQEFLQSCMDSPIGLYLIAEVNGEIAGSLNFNGGKRPRVQHVGEFGTSVQRKYWNLGIGSYMLAYLIDWARATGIIRKINLRVRADNLPAVHLYEKYGFVREGRSTRDMLIRGEFVDCYHMGLEINPSEAEV